MYMHLVQTDVALDEEKHSVSKNINFVSVHTDRDENVACMPYPREKDIKSCFHFSNFLLTKKNSQTWLYTADRRYIPMPYMHPNCSQTDPWKHFYGTTSFQQTTEKRQKCLSQGAGIGRKKEIQRWDSCDLKREQIVQLSDADLSVNFHWHHWDTVVLESMQFVYLYSDPWTII